MQRPRGFRSWFVAGMLAVSALGVSLALAGAPARPYRVAVLTPGGPYFQPLLEGLEDEVARQGYVPGTQLTLLVEDTQGVVPDPNRRAAQLVAAHPDVLVTLSTSYTAAAKQATTSTPIVFVRVGDPLRTGLITSYASSHN